MEIKCPKCNNFFDLSEDIADRIREQIRTKEFEKELNARLTDAKKNYDVQRENAVSEAIIAEREKSEKLLEAERIKAEKLQLDFAELKAQAEAAEKNYEVKCENAVNEAIIAEREKSEKLLKDEKSKTEKLQLEFAEFKVQAEATQISNSLLLENAVNEAKMTEQQKYTKLLEESRSKIDILKQESEKTKHALDIADMKHELDKQKAIEQTKNEYEKKLSLLDNEKSTIEAQYNQLKDFKYRQSTKMLGESLEQHCEIAFEQVRMMAFPKAKFGKDNLVSKSGSKGDYIFREYDENDVEIISIMFEMKNEMDTTATKKKNKDFFKELDKDRNEKKCEYAILVSQLEADSELYNGGIVDVSHEYEKMYVIRPQFFIPLISLLRNAALRSHSAKQELVRMRQQDVDLQYFEAAFTEFKEQFGKNYTLATKRFEEAISEIDKTIEHLNKVKESLLKSGNQLRLANEKVDNVSVRKLTKNSPSIRAMLDEK